MKGSHTLGRNTDLHHIYNYNFSNFLLFTKYLIFTLKMSSQIHKYQVDIIGRNNASRSK